MNDGCLHGAARDTVWFALAMKGELMRLTMSGSPTSALHSLGYLMKCFFGVFVWTAVVVAVTLLAVAGCAKKNGEQIVIGFMVKIPEEPWFQSEIKGARKCAEKYRFKVVDIGARDGDAVLSGIDNLAAQ